MRPLNPSHILHFVLLLSLVSYASAFPIQNALENNKATAWFQKEYENRLRPSVDDGAAPVIYGVSVSPYILKTGDPRSEINARVHDPSGLGMVYAEVGNRMNLMIDLDRDGTYTGYCGSNMPAGTYNVTIIAVDKFGNAAKDESKKITIRDPRDLNGNGIEDNLEEQKAKDLKVIVLHEDDLKGNLTGVGSSLEKRFKVLPGSAMTVSSDNLEKIAKTDGVRGVYTDQKLTVLSTASMSSSNPGPSIIDDPREISGPKGEGVTVALIDTGADADHEALSRKIVAFQDFVNNQTEPYDDNGHGTHCASLIAGDLGMGVAPGAELVVIKVMDRDGACYLSDALKALDWCLDNKDRYGIKIISFSVGGEGPSDGASLLDEACDRMVEEGLTMCVAAGNSGPSPSSIVMPGGAEKVITIGAIDRTGLIFEQSSRGPTLTGEIKPDLVTLGVDVPSALAGSKNGLSSVSGTSMAVPQVSGASAVLLEADPELQPADIKRLLLKTADELGQEGKDNLYGYGALNLTRALGSINAPKEELYPPDLVDVRLNRDEATEGEPVMVEAQASGEIKSLNTKIIGPDRNLEIPMDDLDGNGIYSARWETSFWTAGDYKISVDLVGGFGEVDSIAVPFRLLER